MRMIIIRNIGALEDVDIRLSDINVIIGPQSLGKSTLSALYGASLPLSLYVYYCNMGSRIFG